MNNFVKCRTPHVMNNRYFGVEQSVRHFKQIRSGRVILAETGISTEKKIIIDSKYVYK